MDRKFYIYKTPDAQPLLSAIQKALDKEIPIKVSVKRIRPKKTQQQLAYYFGVVLPAILNFIYDSGYTPNECSINKLHTEFKLMFFYDETPVLKSDKIYRVPKSLSKASIEEMTAFIENVLRWAVNVDIDVPRPPLL